MDRETRHGFQTLTSAVFYVILFLLLIPPLIRLLDDPWGKVLYGVLVVGALCVAYRLRRFYKHGSR